MWGCGDKITPGMLSKNLKWVSLVVLIAQTTALVLILRYSRTQKVQGPKYLSSTAVVSAEVVKLFTCLVVILYNNCEWPPSTALSSAWKPEGFYRDVQADIFDKPADAMKVGVPALLYVIQNNLLFLALTMLDAATYQVGELEGVLLLLGDLPTEDPDNCSLLRHHAEKEVGQNEVGCPGSFDLRGGLGAAAEAVRQAREGQL